MAFLQWALPRMRLRWPGFRKVRRQVCRRIARRLSELDQPDLDAYRRRLEAEPAEWEALEPLCRVTISRFFRDRGVFEALGDLVLPDLARRAASNGRGTVAVWSAGCASGEEPYSLSVLWSGIPASRRRGRALEIVATDSDPHLLDRARRAVYPTGTLREVPSSWRERAFTRGADGWRLEPAIAAAVTLRRRDLRRSTPAGRFDLVLCRNLAFTYFADGLQREVADRLTATLRPGGVLVVGRHEAPPPAATFEAMAEAPSCYRLGKEVPVMAFGCLGAPGHGRP